MPPSDALLARINFDPGSKAAELNPIPWPAGLAPTPVPTANHSPAHALPRADALVITYTAAEGRALADVLTPGITSTNWYPYAKHWASYEPQLTNRSPARVSRRLGSWHLTQIGSHTAVCFKSELHPATDGPQLPLRQLCVQMIEDVRPQVIISTGTAGGVGEGTQLGDVAVASAVQWDCQKEFKTESWATQRYATTPLTATMRAALSGSANLIAVNAGKLPAEYCSRPTAIWESETTVTTDFFAIGDTTDHFGLVALAPDCRAVEMDDAAVGLALTGITKPPSFLSIRNASDPVMPGDEPISEQTQEASNIYQKWGYFTTVASAIACWSVISAL